MLHDVLLALLGFTGHIICEVPLYPASLTLTNSSPLPSGVSSSASVASNVTSQTQKTTKTHMYQEAVNANENFVNILTTFRVAPGYSQINDGDRELIDRIVPLGWYYLKLQEYIKKYSITIQSSNKSVRIIPSTLSLNLTLLSHDSSHFLSSSFL